MQITFNLPEPMECDVKKLAAHLRVSEEILFHSLAFVGFREALDRLFAHELPFEKRTEQTATMPVLIDRSEMKKPAPIDWSKWRGDQI